MTSMQTDFGMILYEFHTCDFTVLKCGHLHNPHTYIAVVLNDTLAAIM